MRSLHVLVVIFPILTGCTTKREWPALDNQLKKIAIPSGCDTKDLIGKWRVVSYINSQGYALGINDDDSVSSIGIIGADISDTELTLSRNALRAPLHYFITINPSKTTCRIRLHSGDRSAILGAIAACDANRMVLCISLAWCPVGADPLYPTEFTSNATQTVCFEFIRMEAK